MNGVTKEISELLNVSLEEAIKIQDYIECNWLLDFSESTQTQFNNVVRYVYNVALKVVG
jgi:hypothetical protein